VYWRDTSIIVVVFPCSSDSSNKALIAVDDWTALLRTAWQAILINPRSEMIVQMDVIVWDDTLTGSGRGSSTLDKYIWRKGITLGLVTGYPRHSSVDEDWLRRQESHPCERSKYCSTAVLEFFLEGFFLETLCTVTIEIRFLKKKMSEKRVTEAPKCNKFGVWLPYTYVRRTWLIARRWWTNFPCRPTGRASRESRGLCD